ncbi:MAG: molybdopterin molybdotransferase MoeA [Betaproteobacteria bacterium]|nr:molybdopterin molybdotransferase MoeA [Betaproteobacteria bacterium]
MLSVEEALAQLLSGAQPLAEIEEISTLHATGRVLARAQRSEINVPPLDNTSMDGYAVRAAECASGETRLSVSQRIPAGTIPKPLTVGTAARIFTGAPIPPGADAVVMQELCAAEGDAVVVRHKPKSGDWIRRVGEDIRAGGQILEAGIKLRPQDTGLAASVGIAVLPVLRRLKVAVFFTGDELVMPGEPLPPGAIYNSNRFTVTAMLEQLGCQVSDFGIIPDSLASTRDALRRAALESDLIITSGGVSVGEEDHVKPAVEAEGRLQLWKIAIKPGKPLAFGSIGREGQSGRPGSAAFIGLPGNPVSAFVTLAILVRPFILRAQGVTQIRPIAFPLRADFDWAKPDSRREYLRARLNASGGLELYPNQSSAVLTSTVWGDGLVDNPPKLAIKRGDMVTFLPFAALFR